MLKLRNITKSFQVGPTELNILKGITLEIKEKEFTGILGASGSGKSTLMNVMGLLDRPTSGEYHMNDEIVSYDNDNYLSDVRNQKIGFVFQAYHLLSSMTALENVGVPLVYRGLGKKEIRERSMEMLRKVEMDDRAAHKPSELSGGQQQRVAIARALVGNPSLILADEPTGALDSRVGIEIMELFALLNDEEGVTMVAITHDSTVAKMCKRAVLMVDGKIVEK